MSNKASDKTMSFGSVVNIHVPSQTALTLNINVQTGNISEPRERVAQPAGSPNEPSATVAERGIAINGSIVTSKAEKSEQSIFNGRRIHIVKEPALDLGARIKIIVETMTGKCMAFSIHTATKVFRLKEAIQDAEGIHPDKSVLMFDGEHLKNER